MRFTPPLLLVVGCLLCGCAAAMPGYTPASDGNPKLATSDPGAMTAAGTYKLSETEAKLDCKRLTGSMQIMILRLRDAKNRPGPSPLATAAQKTVVPLAGGSDAGSSKELELARERARLEAYNRRLAEKQCRTLDIEAELNSHAPTGGKKQ